MDLLDISDWFNRNSCSDSFALLSLFDECTAWRHCNICLFNTHRHTALQYLFWLEGMARGDARILVV